MFCVRDTLLDCGVEAATAFLLDSLFDFLFFFEAFLKYFVVCFDAVAETALLLLELYFLTGFVKDFLLSFDYLIDS